MCRKVNILYYHRVFEIKDDINLLCVTPAKFEQQMRYLKKHYDILRFEEDWESDESDAVVVTFDDGYLDNFQYALPILEELEIPATIFVSTGTLGNDQELWWDELERLILSDDSDLESISIQDDRYGCTWHIGTYELKLNCYYAIHYLMKNFVDTDTRNRWLEQLRKQRNVSGHARVTHKTLNRQLCVALARSKYITIGAHTVSHPSLAGMSAEEQHFEIVDSKKNLEALLNQKIDIFSYPFGIRDIDYNKETIQICRMAGIKKAASTNPGIWTKECDAYEIPRNVVRNWGVSEFQSIIDDWNIRTATGN